jgi:hypothetical protein
MKQPIRYTDKPQIAATLTEFDINDYFELPHHVVLQSFWDYLTNGVSGGFHQ